MTLTAGEKRAMEHMRRALGREQNMDFAALRVSVTWANERLYFSGESAPDRASLQLKVTSFVQAQRPLSE